jgi:uncharacterized membrane protein
MLARKGDSRPNFAWKKLPILYSPQPKTMNTTQVQRIPQRVSPSVSQRVVRFAIVAILTLGILLRFTHINHKVYWTDEVFTALQVSGHSFAEVEQILDGRVITNQDIHRYQFPSPESNKTVRDTVQRLLAFEPQHTPLYFVAARVWLERWGNSMTTLRVMGVLFSLLTLPLMYWFCLELFERSTLAWIGAALVAISPFHVLYAQEARPTVLWIPLTIFSGIALLRARRINTASAWSVYGLSLCLSLYTFLFSVFTIAAHFVYVALADRLKVRHWSYGGVTLMALLSFAPWLWVIIKVRPSNFASLPRSLFDYPIAWLRNLSIIFADFNINPDSPKALLLLFAAVMLMIVAIVSHAFYSLFQQRHLNSALLSAFLMVSSLMFVPVAALLLHDVALQGSATTRGSYFIPSIIGLEILVAYWIDQQLRSIDRGSWLRKGLATCLVTISVLSCGTLIQSETWWLKADDNAHKQVSAIVNQSEKPLVISDHFFIQVFSLSHELNPNTSYSLMVSPIERDRWKLPQVGSGYSDTFLFRPSAQLLAGMRQKFEVKPVIQDVLWKLQKN